jgi:hypothetical protein
MIPLGSRCPRCWGTHAVCSYTAEEAQVVREARQTESAQERRVGAPTGLPKGSPGVASSEPAMSLTSATIFRDGRAFRPGRPRVPVAKQRAKARARARAYRQRRRT